MGTLYTHKAELKQRLPEYLQSIGRGDAAAITNPKKNFRCLHPERHQHGDANPSAHYNDEGRTAVLCPTCSESWDIFKLIGENEGLQDFDSRYRRAAELYGVDWLADLPPNSPALSAEEAAEKLANWKAEQRGARQQPPAARSSRPTSSPPTIQQAPPAKVIEQEPPSLDSFFKQAAEALPNSPGAKYLEGRGISLATAQARGVGYSPSQYFSFNDDEELKAKYHANGIEAPAIILPTGRGSYIARQIDWTYKNGRYMARPAKGARRMFGEELISDTSTEPLYIVEGEFDALAIFEAGGRAIAKGGASKNRLVQLISDAGSDRPYIICMDNDSAGQKQAEALAAELEAVGAFATFSEFGCLPDGEPETDKPNDFNDILQAARAGGNLDALREAVAKEQENAARLAAAVARGKTKATTKPREAEQGALTPAQVTEPPIIHEAKELPKPAPKKSFKAVNMAAYLASGAFDKDIEEFKPFSERRTGFDNLDSLIGALYPGVIGVAAISSLGKTTFVSQLGDQLAERGQHVLYFALEQTSFEMAAKSIARQAWSREKLAITSTQVRQGQGADGESYKAARKYYAEHIAPRVTIYGREIGSKGITYIDVIQATLDYIKAHGVKPIIIIDYVQLLAPTREGQEMKSKLDEAMPALANFQGEQMLTIFAISSVNRANYQAPVDFESMKEAGILEYSCTDVWGLDLQILDDGLFEKDGHAVEKRKAIKAAKAENPRKLKLTILKARFAPTGYACYFDYNQARDFFAPGAEPDDRMCYQMLASNAGQAPKQTDAERAAQARAAMVAGKKGIAPQRRQYVRDAKRDAKQYGYETENAGLPAERRRVKYPDGKTGDWITIDEWKAAGAATKQEPLAQEIEIPL